MEQDLKDTRTKLEQQQRSFQVREQDFEVMIKKLQKENAVALEMRNKLELEKSGQSMSVESCEKTIVELRKEVTVVKQSKEQMLKNIDEQIKTARNLNQQLEMKNNELQEKDKVVLALKESIEPRILEEREKYEKVLKLREIERDNALAKLSELERRLETSSVSYAENENIMKQRHEELTSKIEKMIPLLEERERDIGNFRKLLEQKDKEFGEKNEAFERKYSEIDQAKKMSEEKALLTEQRLESTRQLCQSLKQELKESKIELSQVDAQRQVLQMDLEDKDQLISELEEQKAKLYFGCQENEAKLSQKDKLLVGIEEMQNQKEALESCLNEKEQDLKKAQEEVLQMRILLEDALKSKAALADELSKVTEDKNAAFDSKEMQKAESERLLSELKNTHDIAEQNIRSDLTNKLVTIQRSLDEKSEELYSTTDECKLLQEKFNRNLASLEKVTKDLDCMKGNLKALSSEKSRLSSELERVEQELADQVKRRSELERMVSEKDDLLDTLGKTNDDVIEEGKACIQSIRSTLQSEISTLQDECSEKADALNQEVEKVSQLCNERDELKNLVEKLRAESEIRGRKEQETVLEKEELENSRMDLRKTVEKLEDDLSSALDSSGKERANFQDRLCKMNEEIMASKENARIKESMLEEARNTLESLNSEKECLVMEIRKLTLESEATAQELERTKTGCEDYARKLAEKDQLLVDCEFNIEKLRKELATTEELYESTQSSLDETSRKLKDKLDDEKEKARTSSRNLEEKLVHISSLESDKECLERAIEEKESKIEAISEKLDKAVKENEIFGKLQVSGEQQMNTYKTKVKELQEEMLNMKVVCESAQTASDENMKRANAELNETKKTLEEARKDFDDKLIDIQAMKSEKELLEFQVENIKLANKTLSEKCETSSKERQAYEEKLATSEDVCDDLKMKVGQLQQELHDSHGVLESKQKVDEELENCRHKTTKLNEKLESVKNELNDKDAAIMSLKTEKEHLNFEMENLKRETQTNLQKLERALNDKIIREEKLVASEEKVKECSLVVERLEGELVDVTNAMKTTEKSYDEEIGKLRNQLSNEGEKLESVTKSFLEKESVFSGIQSENEAFKFELESLKSENGAVHEKLDRMKQQCDGYVDKLLDYDKLVDTCAARECEIKNLAKELSGKGEELNQLIVKYDEMKAEMVEEIDDLKKLLEATKGQLGERDSNLRDLETRNEVLSENLVEVEENCRKQEERMGKDKFEFEEKVDKLQKMHEAEIDDLKSAKQQVESLKQQLRDSEMIALSKDAELKKEREELLMQIGNAANDIKEIEQNLSKKEETIVALEQQMLKSMNDKEQDYYEKKLAAKTENERLNEKLHQLNFQNEEIQANLKVSRVDFENQLREKTAVVDRLNGELNEIESEKLVVENENLENLKKLRDLEGQLTRESGKVESSCKRIDELLLSNREQHDAMANAERDFGKVRGELEGEIKVLRGKVDELESSVREYQHSDELHKDLRSNYERTEAALESSNETVMSLRDSLNETRSERDRKCRELTDKFEACNALLKSVQEENDTGKETISNHETTLEELDGKLKEQNDAVNEMKCLLDQKNDEILAKNEELENKVNDFDQIQRDYIQAKEHQSKLSQHLDTMTKELEKCKCRHDEFVGSEELEIANKLVRKI